MCAFAVIIYAKCKKSEKIAKKVLLFWKRYIIFKKNKKACKPELTCHINHV